MIVDAGGDFLKFHLWFERLPWQTKHKDGSDDEDNVKGGQPDQKAVDWTLHLWPSIQCDIMCDKSSTKKAPMVSRKISSSEGVLEERVPEPLLWWILILWQWIETQYADIGWSPLAILYFKTNIVRTKKPSAWKPNVVAHCFKFYSDASCCLCHILGRLSWWEICSVRHLHPFCVLGKVSAIALDPPGITVSFNCWGQHLISL